MTFSSEYHTAGNILILIPVCFSLSCVDRANDPKGKVVGISPTGYRILVLSLWTAIMICSVIGLFFPKQMFPIMVLQIIYKSVYLYWAEWPAFKSSKPTEGPKGLIVSFIGIVMLYPFAVWICLR